MSGLLAWIKHSCGGTIDMPVIYINASKYLAGGFDAAVRIELRWCCRILAENLSGKIGKKPPGGTSKNRFRSCFDGLSTNGTG
jgi:hypothetical protein